MNSKRLFFSENLLLSVAGHLFLIAAMIFSVAAIVKKSTLAAPDRVQITEIDLRDIKIDKETLVHNAETRQEAQDARHKKEQGDEEIKSPALADNKKKPEKNDAPKKKTTVRVNRETASLNRAMTVSVIDALRIALTRCWLIDRNRPDIADIRAVAHLVMRDNGMVAQLWFENATAADTDAARAYVFETIRTAIAACQPFTMLPRSEFDSWKNIQLTFYPRQQEIR